MSNVGKHFYRPISVFCLSCKMYGKAFVPFNRIGVDNFIQCILYYYIRRYRDYGLNRIKVLIRDTVNGYYYYWTSTTYDEFMVPWFYNWRTTHRTYFITYSCNRSNPSFYVTGKQTFVDWEFINIKIDISLVSQIWLIKEKPTWFWHWRNIFHTFND